MPRATVDGRDFPDPTVHGLPTPAGAGYSYGERFINPRLVPRSHFLYRTQTPIQRIPANTQPFRVYPDNKRAGGRVVS
jgi:hypothetical protein